MSRNAGKSQKLELRINLSRGDPSSPKRSSTSSSTSSSPPSSCVSSENEKQDSPEAKSMVLAGCPRCLMYVMLSEEEPKCPNCKSTVLLDFCDGSTFDKSNKG